MDHKRRLSTEELMLLKCGIGEDGKEINPEYSLVGLMLKLQYFGHLMQRANSLEESRLIGKDLDAGKNRRQEEKGMTEDEMAGWHH